MADSPKPTAPVDAAIAKILRTASDKAATEVEQLVPEWTTSVDYRRGKPFQQDSDQDRVYVNVDAPRTRRKVTDLASSVPEARLTSVDPRVKPILDQFAVKLNKVLQDTKTGVGESMWECSCDVVNASGFGWALVGFESRTEDRVVPVVDPMTFTPEQQEAWATVDGTDEIDVKQAGELMGAYGVPTQVMPRVTSSRYYVRRGSPSDFLWDQQFERSNFDKSPWLGHRDRMSFSEAMREFGLKPEDKRECCGEQGQRENLRGSDKDNSDNDDFLVVEYRELFYWRAYYDPNEKYFDTIWRVVYVKGKEEPVVHEAWKGQKHLKGIGCVGAVKLPIRVLTLDYISDDPIPPSDSANARPQVNELMRSRTQMILQRERALPARWHDVNRVDPLTSAQLMKGFYQGSIPVKGNGNAIIGEVARASYPPENFEFDRTIKHDIDEMWTQDDTQRGLTTRGRRTAAESNNARVNADKLTGFQRGRVAEFFTDIAEIIAGLMTLHGQGLPLPQDVEGQEPMDVAQMSNVIDYTVLPDSTVIKDASERADDYAELLNLVGKSGYVNPKYMIEEIFRLKGIDPATPGLMQDPQPQEEKANISYRFGGVQDLSDPIVLAMLIMEGKGPTPEALEEAVNVLKVRQAAIMSGMVPAPPTAENDPKSAGEKKSAPVIDDADPKWNAMPAITKRTSAA